MSAISARWLYVGWGAVTFETNYGLMQLSPPEIKEKLLRALDKDYNKALPTLGPPHRLSYAALRLRTGTSYSSGRQSTYENV
ncbi:transcription coregulator activity protein [Homalodisca vitripennis]|nr:transcription coregulator activity protein [Homalodisca vitripennis]